jgi:hypothetical protein
VAQVSADDNVWTDGVIAIPFEGKSSWRGFGHPLESAKLIAFAPFRRIVPARWLQPLYAIREKDRRHPEDSDKLGDRVFVAKIPFSPEKVIKQQAGKAFVEYKADITAQFDGRLFLFANDVGGISAYANNSGTADISVQILD